jgi:hypothetical protein
MTCRYFEQEWPGLVVTDGAGVAQLPPRKSQCSRLREERGLREQLVEQRPEFRLGSSNEVDPWRCPFAASLPEAERNCPIYESTPVIP